MVFILTVSKTINTGKETTWTTPLLHWLLNSGMVHFVGHFLIVNSSVSTPCLLPFCLYVKAISITLHSDLHEIKPSFKDYDLIEWFLDWLQESIISTYSCRYSLPVIWICFSCYTTQNNFFTKNMHDAKKSNKDTMFGIVNTQINLFWNHKLWNSWI